MQRFFCLFSVFLAIFSQMFFLKESNVFYANILSLLVLPSFVLLTRDGRIKLSYQIKVLTAVIIYFIISYFWSAHKSYVRLEHFNFLILTLVFIICIYNILLKYRTILPVMIAFWAISIFNFLILIDIIPQELFFISETWELRFYGTFNNPNIGSLSFSFALFFADYFLMSNIMKKGFLRIMLILIMIISFSLVVATASKKGIIVLLFYLIYKLLKLTKTSFKNLSFSVILILICFQFLDVKYIDEVVDSSSNRIQRFINETIYSTGEDGSTSERAYFLVEGLTGFFDRPLIGNGFKAFRARYGVYSHNNYVEILYNGGLILFIIYYSMYVFLFKQSNNHNIFAIKTITFYSIICLLLIDMAAVSYLEKNIHYIFCSLFVINSPRYITRVQI